VILQRRDPKMQGQEIWVSDVARGTLDRVTTGPPMSQGPLWSSDGRRVLFQTARNGVNGVYQASMTGGDPQLVIKTNVPLPTAVSPDGGLLLYSQRGQSTRLDLWAVAISTTADSLTASGEPFPVLNSAFDESGADLSPDGRWLAYASDISGTDEIYVRRFYASERKVGDPVRLSTGSGTRPRWRPDGSELFYLSAPEGGTRGELMAVGVKARGETLDLTTATALFTTRTVPTAVFTDYDVTRDGQRFVMGTILLDGPDASRPASIVVLNWMADLQR
jgi:Tol biopolymer transport system component